MLWNKLFIYWHVSLPFMIPPWFRGKIPSKTCSFCLDGHLDTWAYSRTIVSSYRCRCAHLDKGVLCCYIWSYLNCNQLGCLSEWNQRVTTKYNQGWIVQGRNCDRTVYHESEYCDGSDGCRDKRLISYSQRGKSGGKNPQIKLPLNNIVIVL